MATINQALLNRMKAKFGITLPAVRAWIAKRRKRCLIDTLLL
jgi:hypothetical protein